ncbi:hypothetical protein [Streptomyces sp. 6N223]|uniref:hypothetical protein n=1 Tax=Streptomyces sp. 6N223 TaxID=3457412 RepID=UPI003FCEF2FB
MTAHDAAGPIEFSYVITFHYKPEPNTYESRTSECSGVITFPPGTTRHEAFHQIREKHLTEILADWKKSWLGPSPEELREAHQVIFFSLEPNRLD